MQDLAINPLLAESADRRGLPRAQVLLSARIVYGQGSYVHSCTIRDISMSGAAVFLPSGLTIPDDVYLLELKSQIVHEASVVWRLSPLIALKISMSRPLNLTLPPGLSYLKSIWIEAGLR
jgi:hypothetical protein